MREAMGGLKFEEYSWQVEREMRWLKFGGLETDSENHQDVRPQK